MLAVDDIGLPNLGITLDFCHMLMANEHPALSAALCIKRNKLFGVHLNDGYRKNDDGLMIASVNVFQTLEFVYYLIKNRYSEIIYFDTFPQREDPILECSNNIDRMDMMAEIIKNIDEKSLQIALDKQDGMLFNQILWKDIFSSKSKEKA